MALTGAIKSGKAKLPYTEVGFLENCYLNFEKCDIFPTPPNWSNSIFGIRELK